jgi:PEP-CTERM motif-containing protein
MDGKNRWVNRFGVTVLAMAVGLVGASQDVGAAVLVEFDAAAAGAGVDPAGVGWTGFGTPMVNNGAFLLQDNTADDPATSSGEYLSPNAGAGTMLRTSGQYGIEFRVRPLSDVPFFGFSNFANLYVTWSDDQFNFNITIDLDTDDGGPGTTGGIKYGQNSLADAVTGIDWSTPHDIFIGYDSALEQFNFFVDDVPAGSLGYGSIARTPIFPFAQDSVDFGDGTTGQGLDVAAEWYAVRIHDVNSPIPPALDGDLNGDGFVGVDDLNIVLINWNLNVTPGDLLAGDPTGEGFVGVDDLNVVLVNWNNGTPPASGAAIPEPTTLTLLGLGALAISHRRRAS